MAIIVSLPFIPRHARHLTQEPEQAHRAPLEEDRAQLSAPARAG
jgi:hypothetical protein